MNTVTPTTTTAPASPVFPTFLKIGRVLERRTRILRRIFFSKTSLKVYLITASVICLGHNGVRWHVRHALQAEQERVAALGMATEWRDLLPPMPADADNFFAAPLFMTVPDPEAPPLSMWLGGKTNWHRHRAVRDKFSFFHERTGTLAEWCAFFRALGTLPEKPIQDSPARELAADARWQPVIQAVYAAAERPEARRPPAASAFSSYNNSWRRDDLSKMARCLQLYARASLETGNVGPALPALRVFRHLVAATAADAGPDKSWEAQSWLLFQKPILLEGMTSHLFPAEALTAVIKENYPEVLRKTARRSMEASRLGYLEAAEIDAAKYLAGFPISSPDAFIRWAMPEYYPLRNGVFVSRFQSDLAGRAGPLIDDETWASRSARPGSERILVYGQEMNPRATFDHVLTGPVVSATLVHLTAALELHYLKHGRYPATLAELETDLSPGALRDTDGQPFGYSMDAEGAHFTLTSSGRYDRKDIWSTLPARP